MDRLDPEQMERMFRAGFTQKQVAALARRSEPVPAKVVNDCAIIAEADVKDHFQKSQGPDGPWPAIQGRIRQKKTPKPLLDTGQLRASITHRSEADRFFVGTNKVQAGIHNAGGVIRARNAKYLCIPLTQEAVNAGSPRRFPRPLEFFINRAGTGGFMFERPVVRRRGRIVDADPIDHYWLTKSVTIPKREFLWLSEDCHRKIRRRIDRWFEVGV